MPGSARRAIASTASRPAGTPHRSVCSLALLNLTDFFRYAETGRILRNQACTIATHLFQAVALGHWFRMISRLFLILNLQRLAFIVHFIHSLNADRTVWEPHGPRTI